MDSESFKGGLLIATAFGTMAGIPVAGFLGGIGTVIAYQFKDLKYKPYYEYDTVQEIVEDTLKDELAELEEARENGDITAGEYVDRKQQLDKKSHYDQLTKDTAAEVFADDEKFQGFLKQDDSLKKAYISLFSIGGGTLILNTFLFANQFDKMIRTGFEMLDGGIDYELEQERREKEKKRKEKKLKKEMEEYSEEIEE